MSVLRYVQRVREPLVVDDATRDDRFASDPYVTGVAGCSLLALPVLDRGSTPAVLVLENRHARPVGAPPAPEPVRVQRRVSCRGALVVAKQRIHVGIVHAGHTLTVEAADTTPA